MTDQEKQLPPESSGEPKASDSTRDATIVVTSITDLFGDAKARPTRWLKAARSGPIRVLAEEQAVALSERIAGDVKLLDRLVGVLRGLAPAKAIDVAGAAILGIAERVIKHRMPDMYGQDSVTSVDLVLVTIARLRRELKAGRARNLWLELILRTVILNKNVDSAEFPRLIRAAFSASSQHPNPSRRRSPSLQSSGIVFDEEAALLFSFLGKPPMISSSLAISSVYQRRVAELEDAIARLEAQIFEREAKCDRLASELASETDLANLRSDQIDGLRKEGERRQATWDARHTEALHRIETMRGRILGLLRGDLVLWLETARDAAAATPPRIAVVAERLERAIQRAAKETEWLTSSDST